jgi:hypothetical protein
VIDSNTSPYIDAGDPNSPIGLEPFPNGGRINMGAYGGTSEASKTYFGKPLCDTIIAGDINGDCKVDIIDLEILMNHWLEDNAPGSEIINGVEFRVQTDKTFYKQGESVKIDFTVKNLTNEVVHIVCYKAPEFNLLVQKDVLSVWRFYNGLYLPYLPDIKLNAGEFNGISHSWDMKDDYGYLVGPGTYEIVGEIYTYLFDPDNPGLTQVRIPITISPKTDP